MLGRLRTVDHTVLGVVAILAVGIALRAIHLGQQSLWVDELGEATIAKASLPQLLSQVRSDYGAAPLDYIGVKLFTSVLGHGTVATRSWAFAMGCLAILMIYLLGARLYKDRAVGLIAALMLAFSAFHIYYSQEARFYALPVLVGMLNLYFFLRALDSGALKDWVVYSVATVIALYSHYFLAVLLPVEGLYLAGARLALSIRNRSDHPLRAGLMQIGMCLAAQVAAVLIVAPWLAFALPSQVAAGYPALPPLGLERIHHTFVVLIGLAPLNSAAVNPLPPVSLGKVLRADIVLALSLTGIAWALAVGRTRVLLLAGILVVSIPLAWRADQVGQYFFSERQVIFVLVPLYVLAAIGARHLLRVAALLVARLAPWQWFGFSGGSRWERGLPIAFGVVFALAWAAVYWSPIHVVYQDLWLTKADWRGVAAYIDRTGCPDTQYWTFLGGHYSYGFAYYSPSLMPRSHFLFVLPDGTYDPAPIDAVQRQHLGSNDAVILDAGTMHGSTEDAAMRSQGWSPTSFLGLVLYQRQTCTAPA